MILKCALLISGNGGITPAPIDASSNQFNSDQHLEALLQSMYNIIGILDGEESDIGFFGMRKNYIGWGETESDIILLLTKSLAFTWKSDKSFHFGTTMLTQKCLRVSVLQ